MPQLELTLSRTLNDGGDDLSTIVQKLNLMLIELYESESSGTRYDLVLMRSEGDGGDDLSTIIHKLNLMLDELYRFRELVFQPFALQRTTNDGGESLSTLVHELGLSLAALYAPSVGQTLTFSGSNAYNKRAESIDYGDGDFVFEMRRSSNPNPLILVSFLDFSGTQGISNPANQSYGNNFGTFDVPDFMTGASAGVSPGESIRWEKSGTTYKQIVNGVERASGVLDTGGIAIINVGGYWGGGNAAWEGVRISIDGGDWRNVQWSVLEHVSV